MSDEKRKQYLFQVAVTQNNEILLDATSVMAVDKEAARFKAVSLAEKASKDFDPNKASILALVFQ